jgi:hypothetical protein
LTHVRKVLKSVQSKKIIFRLSEGHDLIFFPVKQVTNLHDKINADANATKILRVFGDPLWLGAKVGKNERKT